MSQALILSPQVKLRRSYWCQRLKNKSIKVLDIKGFPWFWTHIQSGFKVTVFFIVRTYLKLWKHKVVWILLLFGNRVDEITVNKVASGYNYCKNGVELSEMLNHSNVKRNAHTADVTQQLCSHSHGIVFRFTKTNFILGRKTEWLSSHICH